MAKTTVPVLEMSCVVCAGNVERTVRGLKGVTSANVNFAANSITIDYDPRTISLTAIRDAVVAAGYDLVIDNSDEARQEAERKSYRQIRRRLIVAWVLAVPVMVLTMAVDDNPVARWAAAVLATVILVYSGHDFYVKAWKMARQKSANMDTLVALSTAVAWLFSFVLLLLPGFSESHGMGHYVYFDSATMIVAFVLTGRLLEERAKNSTTSAIRSLMNLQPPTALRLSDDGTEQEVPVVSLAVGDRVSVRPGSRIAVDGKVCAGHSFVDESMLTGESMQVEKSKDDKVYSGTVNKNGVLTVEVTNTAENTLLSRIVDMVREAQGSKAPVQRIADRISKYFTFAIVAIAIVTFICWMLIGGNDSLPRAIVCSVSVLVIACPCALGLATPTAITVGIGKAAEHHILIKNAASLEQVCRITTVVLDKTGTLTTGHPEVKAITYATTQPSAADLSVLMAAEMKSEHPLAEVIVGKLKEKGILPAAIDKFESLTGKGVSATVGNQEYWAGNTRLACEKGCKSPLKETPGATIVHFGKGPALLAEISLADTLKPTSVEAVANMKRMGLHVCMLTGDNESAAAAIAREADIDEYVSETLPDDKDRFVRRKQDEGETVAMVGDGINDSQALARADIGIAMGSGTDIAMETAMMTFTTSDLRLLPKAVRLSKKTMRIVRQNLFWAFIYNVIGIPVAAGALFPVFGITINPMWASAAMALSSVTVVTNSLRLRFVRI